jgi:protein-tyrosine phosphatase
MREIIPHQLWLGNSMDLRDPRRLHDAGICAIVDLAFEELPPQLARDFIYCRFPLVDGGGNSRELLAVTLCQTVALIQRHIPTLAACGAGLSRSVSLVATALAIINSRSPDDCLKELVENQPRDVSPILWADMKMAYYEVTK